MYYIVGLAVRFSVFVALWSLLLFLLVVDQRITHM